MGVSTSLSALPSQVLQDGGLVALGMGDLIQSYQLDILKDTFFCLQVTTGSEVLKTPTLSPPPLVDLS